jgi:hypothetical protein
LDSQFPRGASSGFCLPIVFGLHKSRRPSIVVIFGGDIKSQRTKEVADECVSDYIRMEFGYIIA